MFSTATTTIITFKITVLTALLVHPLSINKLQVLSMCDQAREDSIDLNNLVTVRHEMVAAGQLQDWPRVVQVLAVLTVFYTALHCCSCILQCPASLRKATLTIVFQHWKHFHSDV
jgi:hypothetical protein